MADVPEELLQHMTNRRAEPAPLVLLHGALSDGSAWYPIVTRVFEPFFSVSLPKYEKLRRWVDIIRHWRGSEDDREQEILEMRDELVEQLHDVLRTTAPTWTGRRLRIIAHSYGTILTYRYFDAYRDAHSSRILFRGCPLSPSLPFDSWVDRAGPIENLAGQEDPVLTIADLMHGVMSLFIDGSSMPPHFGGVGSSATGSAGLAGGHVVDVDPELAHLWRCTACGGSASWVHTWRVPLLDHNAVSPADVRSFWFPLVQGWEPATWDRHVQSLQKIVAARGGFDEVRFIEWLGDRSLRPLWDPYDSAADTIRAEVHGMLSSREDLRKFTKALPHFERVIARLYVMQARAALLEWHLASSAERTSQRARAGIPEPDARRALLPDALATLTRIVVHRVLNPDGK